MKFQVIQQDCQNTVEPLEDIITACETSDLAANIAWCLNKQAQSKVNYYIKVVIE